LNQLREKRPARLKILQQRTWLLVILEDRDPGSILEALRAGDSFIFLPESVTRLPLVLAMACVGYCVIPPLLMPALARGQLRLELLRRLSPRQAKVLHLLSLGLSNESIARALHLDQPRTKYLIRSTLKTLHLRNRTQAAVFATRDAFPLPSERAEASSRIPSLPDDSRLH
jgi:DNA-binding NarL/FixJ family response regulator